MKRLLAPCLFAAVSLVACGGGGGGGTGGSPVPVPTGTTSVPGGTVTPTPTPTPSPSPTPSSSSQTKTVTLTGGSQTVSYAINGYTANVTYPASSAGVSLQTTLSNSQPSGTPALQGMRRRASSIGSTPAGLAYLCITPASTVNFSAFPTVALTVPSTTQNAQNGYAAIANPFAPASWNVVSGPASVSGSTLTFSGASPGPTLIGGQTYCVAYVTTAAALASASPVLTSSGVPAWTASQHQGYTAFSYGGNPPQYIAIYAPGQSTPSATITYNSCCIFSLAFDAQGNLYAATASHGVLVYAPGASSPTATLSGSGFSIAIDAQRDVAVGGYNSGPNVEIYPGASASGVYTVAGQPAFQGLAFSGSGELAVPQSDGTIKTFARGATSANRTIPTNLIAPSGVNTAIVAYDGNGNLGVAGGAQNNVWLYAPGSISPSATISNAPAQGLAFDAAGRVIVAAGAQIDVFAPSSGSTPAAVIPISATGVAVDAAGNIAGVSWSSSSAVYGVNAVLTTIPGMPQAQGVAISP